MFEDLGLSQSALYDSALTARDGLRVSTRTISTRFESGFYAHSGQAFILPDSNPTRSQSIPTRVNVAGTILKIDPFCVGRHDRL